MVLSCLSFKIKRYYLVCKEELAEDVFVRCTFGKRDYFSVVIIKSLSHSGTLYLAQTFVKIIYRRTVECLTRIDGITFAVNVIYAVGKAVRGGHNYLSVGREADALNLVANRIYPVGRCQIVVGVARHDSVVSALCGFVFVVGNVRAAVVKFSNVYVAVIGVDK